MICSTTGPEKITPEWLTAVFRKEGLLDSGHVTRVRAFCSKTLPVSQVSRLAVKYSSNVPDGLPVKFFLKLSKPGREAAVKSDIGQNESRFYQLMRGEISGAPLVRCFVNEALPESGVTCLVMEDLTDTHFQPASPNAPSEAQSISAVECLARFHAHWWNHPKLGREVGRVFDAQWLKIFLRELESSVARFVEFLGDDLSSERGQVYRNLLSSSSKIWGRLNDPSGLTVTHGDAHWWNFLYPRDPAREKTRIFDWQLWHLDLGARDLAFLVALGGFAERRPALDARLAELYHAALIKNGVRNYAWRTFFDDYRYSAIRNLNIPVIFWSQGKHHTTWSSALERAFQAYDELGCEELLTD